MSCMLFAVLPLHADSAIVIIWFSTLAFRMMFVCVFWFTSVIVVIVKNVNLCSVQVTGVIQDSAGNVRYVLSGTWDDKIEGAPVLNTIESSKGKVMYETGETKVLWQRRYPP